MLTGWNDTLGRNKCFGIASMGNRRNDDTVFFRCGMDEIPIADVDTHMCDGNASFLVCKKEEKIAFL